MISRPGAAILIALMVAATVACSHPQYAQSPEYKNGQFHNTKEVEVITVADAVKTLWRFQFEKTPDAAPAQPIPVQAMTRESVQQVENDSVVRLGHSTLLFKMRDQYWLTDPMFSVRASPIQWMGPKRFHPPPISIEDLPPIAAVILSHNHYDHLDKASILKLSDKTAYFLTPLGVGDILIAWGIPSKKVIQLDWWQSYTLHQVSFSVTPNQHFSGRMFVDNGQALWSSWVIVHDDVRVFFGGDGGYSEHFKKIGSAYGPFDMTFLENGAYDKSWPNIHMQPEQTLQAHLDLQGKCLVPIHNSTFDLANHAWYEPLERITALGAEKNVEIATPEFGQAISIKHPAARIKWWKPTANSGRD